MSIFKFEFAHTIKQIWVIGEVMPEVDQRTWPAL